MTNSSGERPVINPSRRHFLAAGAAATALAADAARAQAPAPAGTPQPAPVVHQNQVPRPGQIPAPGPQGYRFLTSAEVETLTAMVDRLIPADDFGPGGVEAEVVTFVDRGLGGQFGAATRWYMAGPWSEGTRSQGWQLALTPAQIYRNGFLALDRWCLGSKNKRFVELDPTDQDENSDAAGGRQNRTRQHFISDLLAEFSGRTRSRAISVIRSTAETVTWVLGA